MLSTHRFSRRLRRRAVIAAVLLGAATGVVPSALLQRASATLAGSTFNGADAVLDAGVTDTIDASGTADTTNYSNGSTEDTICPGVATGTAPNSDDLDHFYMGTETNASGVFIYLAWHRISNNGTKTLDFELNQATGLAPGCTNGVTPARTAGDRLISYDFSGGGGTVTLNERIWVGTATAGAWSAPTAIVTAEEASVNLAGDFGEMVINGTGSGLLPAGVCTNFASAYAKSHASNSFVSELKDFTNRVTRTVSNCGSILINKTDDANPANAVNGAVFHLYTDVANAPGVDTGKTCTTSAGTCTISNIIPGSYFVVEDALAGYTIAAPRHVTVGIGANTPANPLTIVNTRLPASIIIDKLDDSTPPVAVNGAVFSLYTDNGASPTSAPGSAVAGKTCTTALGTCTISSILPPGTYWVEETTTPAGHDTAASQKVTLALNQNVALTFIDPRQPATITIVKTDDSHPSNSLDGAVFGLFTDTAGVLGTAVTGKTCTTAAGTCSITGILPSGTYWVRETTTPAGYATADDQKVTLGLNQTMTLTFVDAVQPSSISLTKTVNNVHPTATSPLMVEAGSTLAYALTITNTGRQPLDISALTDSLQSLPASCLVLVGSTLAPATPFTCTYTATAAAAAHNVAAVAGTDLLGRSVSAQDETFVTPIHPAIGIVKTANPTSVSESGIVTFTYVVTNTGDAVLHDVVVTDDVLGAIGTIASLAPGASGTLTKTMTIEANSPVVNVAIVTGTDPLGLKVSATAKATISIVLGLTLSRPAPAPTLPRTGAAVGGELRLATLLLGLGFILVIVTRQRRPQRAVVASNALVVRTASRPRTGEPFGRTLRMVSLLGGFVLGSALVARRRRARPGNDD